MADNIQMLAEEALHRIRKLRCLGHYSSPALWGSNAHVHNVLGGKVAGVPKLTHLTLGRRRLVRREWLDQWLEASKTR